jgi:hypothetical protein
MGATQWSYFVPYQSDINEALQQLQDEIFKQGEYEQPFGFNQTEVESQLDYLAAAYQSLPKEIREHTDQFMELARTAAKQHQPRLSPKSIKQLLERCGTEGTHSILDIERISPEPTFGAIAPLPRERVLEIFGTEYPTRDMVAEWSARVDSLDAEPLYRRWEGIYIIVYRDTEPVEIYFEGCSGD